MCDPALFVGAIMSIAQIGIQSAAASSQEQAARRANDIARRHSMQRRLFESQQLTAEKGQASRKLQAKRHAKTIEGIESRGRLQAAVAETGLGGGLVRTLYRSINLDEASQVGAIDVSVKHLSEASYLKDVGSVFKMNQEIERLPAVQSSGLGIASAVIGGFGTFLSTSSAVGKAIEGDDWSLRKAFTG